jgi:hypothetical protein
MTKRDVLKLPDEFEANVRALLGTPPAPHGTAGSRKAAPKPAKPKTQKAHRRTKAEAAAHRAGLAEGVRYEYERAPVKARTQKPKTTKK